MELDNVSDNKLEAEKNATASSHQKSSHQYLLVALSGVMALFALNEFTSGLYLGSIANMVGVGVCLLVSKGVEAYDEVPVWLRLVLAFYLMAHVSFLAVVVHNGTPALWMMCAPVIAVMAFRMLLASILSILCLGIMIGLLLYAGPFSIASGNPQALITVGATYALIMIAAIIRERSHQLALEKLRRSLTGDGATGSD